MQPVKLELLAPARNKEIGIAAIDCGADAVYIAGPSFGARAAAGNPIEDIRSLAGYAHRYGAKVYATVNTIIYEEELQQAQRMIWELYDAGVDALIVQDLGITQMDLPPIELHASTQCAIRTPDQAAMLASLGFTRLILERQLSLEEIRAIREAVSCELEFFVHGAICVSYSGNCYLSQCLAGRSANRGACIQACRSLYDVVDGSGRVLKKNCNILSPKDFCLDGRLAELAEAGICSFKIEGRLKSASYVKNVVRHYRSRLDSVIAADPRLASASDGRLEGGFTPNAGATFNRGYTEFFIDGRRGKWRSAEGSKSLGEYLGTVERISGPGSIVLESPLKVSNGDGLVFVTGEGENIGMRADVVRGREITLKDTSGLFAGQKVFRNLNIPFEKELQGNMPRRALDAEIWVNGGCATARDAATGLEATLPLPQDAPVAQKPQAALEGIARQLGKRSGIFDFRCTAVEQSPALFYSAASLNALRRALAEELERLRLQRFAEQKALAAQAASANVKAAAEKIAAGESPAPDSSRGRAIYSANCANSLARKVLLGCGFDAVDDAYEIDPPHDAALMRSRYCIRYELGLCPSHNPGCKVPGALFLLNSGRRLHLEFDCKRCEMVISL